MNLRPGDKRGNGIAVFPFLKTTDSIRLGSFTFRSTKHISDLSEEDSAHVKEIGEMLFLQDDLRIQAASYTTLPPTDPSNRCLLLQRPPPNLWGPVSKIRARQFGHLQPRARINLPSPSRRQRRS